MQTLTFDITNDIKNRENELNNVSQNMEKLQNNFLKETLSKTINGALDIGIKAVLPDLIENEIIDIKDVILENGFEEGIKEIINSGKDFCKSAAGIITGNFENIDQIQMVVRKGGILDKSSELFDNIINTINNKNIINKNTANLIRQGKNSIISSISNKIEETLINQIKAVEKIEKFTKNWNMAYGIQDFEKMETAYKNIKNNLEKTFPIEKIINNARKIENIHNLIKNNNKDFNINEKELELAMKI